MKKQQQLAWLSPALEYVQDWLAEFGVYPAA